MEHIPKSETSEAFLWKNVSDGLAIFSRKCWNPRSNSCQHVGTGSNIVQMQIYKHKIDFVYKSDTSGDNKMHQKLTRSFHLPGHWQNDSYIFCILNAFGQKACMLAIHQGVKGKGSKQHGPFAICSFTLHLKDIQRPACFAWGQRLALRSVQDIWLYEIHKTKTSEGKSCSYYYSI